MRTRPRANRLASILATMLGGLITVTAAQAQNVGADTPNGGRREVHTVAEMRDLRGYRSDGGRAYSDLAAEAGGKDWPVTLYYHCNNTAGRAGIAAKPPPPIEVFDGVYSVGTEENNVWAIKTSAGVILLDALSNAADARQYIVRGLASFGITAKDIKVVLVSHGHFDHAGGVPYLRSLSPDLRVGMSALDWPVLPKKPHDFVITDGMKISLGGFTITAILTPGHTPGTVSYVFPVTDKGAPHVASLFGGQAAPKDVASLILFRRSLNHFEDFTDLVQADVVLSNHTVGDDGLTKVALLERRKPGDPNPYVVGREGVVRYDASWRACLSAKIAESVARGATYDPLKVGVDPRPMTPHSPGARPMTPVRPQ